ncbi:S8 family serine peptidase [Anoxybacter fermentans]
MLFTLGSVGFAFKPDVEKKAVVPLMADKDNDKIFDDLALKLKDASDSDEFKVIAVFNESYNLQGIKNAIGHFATSYEYININAFAATLNKGQIIALSKMPQIKHIQLDAEVKATMYTASSWFGVTKARNDWGVTGDRDGSLSSYSKNDIVIAIIDTGIDTNHQDLDGGKVIAWKDFVNGNTTPYDDNGHGTHCASIAAGSGDANWNYRGVAYGAALIGLKVLDANGSGSMSNVDAAIDWCITNKDTYNIRVISMSLSTSSSSDGQDSTSLLVNQAYNNGIVVVVAAGNSGSGGYTIGSPSAAENAITVGAMADVGEYGFFLADFSSRGYTADGRIKPDICAPGYNIIAAAANTTSQYTTKSGTSMATPFVAGTVALMLDANPNLTPADVKTIIQNTAEDWGKAGKDIDYGWGRLQAYEAIKSAGGYSGTGPWVPYHAADRDYLPGTGYYDTFKVYVSNTSYPIAVNLIMENATNYPDFDLYVYGPDGYRDAYDATYDRQEQVKFLPDQTGWYTIYVYSYSGSGYYYVDVSVNGSNFYQYANDSY